jgi:hypothetical protein
VISLPNAISHGTYKVHWVLFVGIATIWLSLFYDRGFNHFDEGNAIYPAIRVLNGELPHRDFATLYTGGIYYLYAALFKIFGIHAGLIRVSLAVAVGLTSIMTAAIAGRLIPGMWRFLPALVFLFAFPINPTAFHSWYAVLFGITSLLFLVRFLETGHAREIALAGFAAGLGFLSKQTMGAFTLAGLASVILCQMPLFTSQILRRIDRITRTTCMLVGAFIFTIYIEPAWSRQPHVGYLFLGLPWLLPILIWIPETERNPRSGGTSPLLLLSSAFLVPVIVFSAHFVWNESLDSLVYGTFEFPAQYLMIWVQANRFPRLEPWVQNPLGTFLLLLLAPAWRMSIRFKHAKIRKYLWPLACILLLVFPVRLALDAVAAWSSTAAFLAWANLEVFYSVVFLAPVLVPWLVFPALILSCLRPNTIGCSSRDHQIVGAVLIVHIFAQFCIYPMQHPFYLVYIMPTSFALYTFLVQRLWQISKGTDRKAPSLVAHTVGLTRLASMLSLPITAMVAFVIWGSQYLLELRTLAADGQIRVDQRVPFASARASWGLAVKPHEAAPIDEICQILQARTAPEDPVFVAAANGPLIMFLAERDTPARIHFPLGPLSDQEQTEIIAALERTQTESVIMDGRFDDARLMWQYLLANYDLDQEIGEYKLFSRRERRL